MQQVVAAGVEHLDLLEECIKETWFVCFLAVDAAGLLRLSKVLHTVWRLVVDLYIVYLSSLGREGNAFLCAVLSPFPGQPQTLVLYRFTL